MAGQSFKFWTSYLTALDRMDDATAGRLVKALARCVFEGEQPDFADAPHLWPTFDVMLEQAKTSCELSEKARKGGQRSGQTRREKSGSAQKTKGVRTGFEGCSSEMKREEMKGNEISSLSERKAARAAAAAPGGATSAAPDEFPQPAVPPKQHIARPAGE